MYVAASTSKPISLKVVTDNRLKNDDHTVATAPHKISPGDFDSLPSEK